MKINIHAGHANIGGGAIGSVGVLNESVENRVVKDKVMAGLIALGHTVYDCTVDKGDKNEVLKNIIKKSNEHSVDLDVSIHFNAFKDLSSNGTEVYIHSANSRAKGYAEKVCSEISKLGFKNRGVKTSQSLYFLNHSKYPAMLIECCFINGEDAKRYNSDKMANAIVRGLVGEDIPTKEPEISITITDSKLSRVQTGAFSKKAGAEDLLKRVKNAGFSDAYITKKDGLYKVQVGAYSKKENAKNMLKKIKVAGFDAFITN